MHTDLAFRNQVIDKVLSLYYEKKDYKFGAVLVLADLHFSNRESLSIADTIQKIMIAEGLIEIYGNPDYAQITHRGEEVYEKGGWLAYLKERQVLKQKEKRKTDLTLKDLELSIRNAELSFFQIKHWWLVIAVSALLWALLNTLLDRWL